MTRTDVHAPASTQFDPELYELVDVYDLHPDENSWHSDHAVRYEDVNRMRNLGYRFASHQHLGQCGHCGAHIRYAALMARADVHELIYVGETCLDNRFMDLTKAQFDALRKAAQLDREKQRMLVGFDAFLIEHPEIVPATYVHNLPASNSTGYAVGIVEDIMRKARTYGGQISAKQIAFVVRLMGEIEDKLTMAIAAPVVNGDAPRGRCKVTGTVVSIKTVPGYNWNTTDYKMVVKFDNGSRAYGSIPAAISHVVRDDVVTFTAEFMAPTDGASDFAFYKRPTKASVAE